MNMFHCTCKQQSFTKLACLLFVRWVHPINRSLLSHFYSSGVPELTGPSGSPMTFIEILKNETDVGLASASVALENFLSRQFVIQLMGISL